MWYNELERPEEDLLDAYTALNNESTAPAFISSASSVGSANEQ